MSWVAAFLVHSTLWLGLAWLISRLRPSMHGRVRETLWHTAIAASLIAPTAQVMAPAGASAFWSLPLPTAWMWEDSAAAEEAVAVQPAPARLYAPAQPTRQLPVLDLSAPSAEASVLDRVAASLQDRDQVGAFALGTWLSIALGLLLRYGLRLTAVRRRMDPREVVTSAPEQFALAQLCRRAGLRRTPRLTESENIGSPLALGVGRRAEICLPTRALHELDHDQFCAMLGHEVAHHMRRDPLRLFVMHALQALFFFQPLFRVAKRQLHLASEELCDAWGASHLEDRLAMARCLTEVAAWVLPQDRNMLVAGMARRRSQLGKRVERLMDDGCSYQARGGSLRALASACVLALAPWLAPTVTPAIAHPAAEGLALEAELVAASPQAKLLLELLEFDSELAAQQAEAKELYELALANPASPRMQQHAAKAADIHGRVSRLRMMLRRLLAVFGVDLERDVQ